jgi:hypothetical protein
MQLLAIASTALIGWLMYRTVRNNPAAFSKENLGKSFYTVGLLTLGLIGFIALLVYLLKH